MADEDDFDHRRYSGDAPLPDCVLRDLAWINELQADRAKLIELEDLIKNQEIKHGPRRQED